MNAPIPPGVLEKMHPDIQKLIRGDIDKWMDTESRVLRDLASGATPKKIFDFVKDGVFYINDPMEHFQPALETMNIGKGDCEDHAFLLASLFKIAGVPNAIKIAFVPQANMLHAYNSAKINGRWRDLDTTNKNSTIERSGLPFHVPIKTITVL